MPNRKQRDSQAIVVNEAGERVKTQQERDDERLLHVLSELGGSRIADEDLIYRGDQLIIPARWTADDAVEYIRDHIEQQNEETSFTRVYRYRPHDGAHALQNALRRVFGTAGLGKPIFTFFGPQPPELINVPTGIDSSVQVPWGKLEAPLFGGSIYTGVKNDPEYGPLFELTVHTKRKHKAHVEGLFRAIQEELCERSLYKGKAVNGATEPEFLDLRGVDPAKVVYSDEVATQITANVWSLLDHTDTMREMGLPLKRAVLLEGDYGTGKTLAAFLTAQRAIENGWSFVYCRPGKDDLDMVMSTARLYQPAVVFFEDVDTIAASGDRDHVSRLLDTFDGITAKGTELVCILTTNHKERIVKGMVRPGRLDAVIHFGGLDVPGIERLVKALIPGSLLPEEMDFQAIGEAMGVGTERAYLPAFAKEAIDRAIRYTLARTGTVEELSTEDFVEAAQGLQPQLDLMLGASEGALPDTLDAAMKKIAQGVVHSTKVVHESGQDFGVLLPAANGDAR